MKALLLLLSLFWEPPLEFQGGARWAQAQAGLARLGDEDYEERQRAQAELTALGPAGLRAALAGLASRDLEVQKRSAGVLWQRYWARPAAPSWQPHHGQPPLLAVAGPRVWRQVPEKYPPFQNSYYPGQPGYGYLPESSWRLEACYRLGRAYLHGLGLAEEDFNWDRHPLEGQVQCEASDWLCRRLRGYGVRRWVLSRWLDLLAELGDSLES